MIGTVNWFASKGQSYGFIGYSDWDVCDGKPRQVYVHYKSIGTKNLRPENLRGRKWFKELRKGDIVSFDIVEGFGVDGTQAINVEIVSFG
jgi:cold shock CspA family protein